MERTLAAKEITGAGMKSEEMYDQLATNLEDGLSGLDKMSPRVQELAWTVKALASSGSLKYMELVERTAVSGVSSLERHALAAKEILAESSAKGRPYLETAKVPILTESQAANCEMIRQGNCRTSRSADKCITKHKTQAVQLGGNAIVIMHSDSRTIGFGPFGGDSSMIANYYWCE
ncbi:MAG: hypothetical protein ABIR16_07605 [Dokdonella sp.]